MKSVAVIIANYNGEKFLEDCLKSVSLTEYENFKVVLVDDGSNDESLNIANSWKSKINLEILKRDHKGASSARNYAIEKYKDVFDVLIFLDNDTEVTPSWISEIVNTLYSKDEIGGAQSLLRDYKKREEIQSAGIKLIPHTCWGVSIGQGQKDFNPEWKGIEIAAISACLGVKSEIFKNTAPFDEMLSVSTEDIDLTWRIYLSGYKIILAEKSIVYHYTKTIDMRKDMNVNLEKQYFHISKNSIRSILKNYSLLYLFYYLPCCLFINMARATLVLIVRKDASSLKGFFRACLWNITNFVDTINHRKLIQKNRVLNDRYIYEKIMVHDNLYEIYKKYFSQTKLLG